MFLKSSLGSKPRVALTVRVAQMPLEQNEAIKLVEISHRQNILFLKFPFILLVSFFNFKSRLCDGKLVSQ